MRLYLTKIFLLSLLCCSFKSFGQQYGKIFISKQPDKSSTHNTLSFRSNNLTAASALTIVSPADSSTFNAGTSITLYLEITNPTDTIKQIAFYNYGIQFYKDTIPPFSFVRMNAEPGIYLISAKAFFSKGDSIVSDTIRIIVTGCAGSGTISAEGYTNIPGSEVADLTKASKYPNHPDVTSTLTVFEYGPNYGDNYGGRLRGYICVPATGDYTFYIAGDDQAGLWLSPDENPGNKVLIAYNETHVGLREWYKFPSQKSAPITLIRGVRYYIETLHKQAIGPNNLSVAWQIPGGAFEGPIPGKRLSPYGSVFPNVVASPDFAVSMQRLTFNGFKLIATPNPTVDYFTLVTQSSGNTPVVIIVTDIAGRILERKANNAANQNIQFGRNLPAGIFFVEVTQGVQKQILKVVKQ